MTQANFVDAKNRLYLMLYDIINYNDVISAADSRVSKKCTFHWCTDCGKHCCLICQGQKLLGLPSYIDWTYRVNH